MSALFVQPNGTIVVDSSHPDYSSVRAELAVYAELISQADRLHVYRVSSLTLWQAAAAGWTIRRVLECLRLYCEFPLPYAFQSYIAEQMNRWGKVRLDASIDGQFILSTEDLNLKEVANRAKLGALSTSRSAKNWHFPMSVRAEVKQHLTAAGFPCLDRIGYQPASTLEISLCSHTQLRDYQHAAMQRFLTGSHGHNAVIVLPCGSGKTVVGIACICQLRVSTLILAPTESAALQWIRELRRWANVHREDVSLYRPTRPLTPITVTTYQRVTAKTKQGEMTHLNRLAGHSFGFVIYDEVHVLPAPFFRLAAQMQSVRRLGLTATLVREDGAQTDVFTLIGPKCYEADWKQLERQGYLASIRYVQVRVPLTSDRKRAYASAGPRERHKLAALNPAKLHVMNHLVGRHDKQSVLVIGHFLAGLGQAAKLLGCPVITGQVPQAQREDWLNQFRNGSIRQLVLSRVANMAIDLPSASVAIQLSGLYGSRQEEAQRFGRLLRPASGPATFYSLVSQGTVEEEFSHRRSLYLTAQGYTFEVTDWPDTPRTGSTSSGSQTLDATGKGRVE